VGFPFLTLVLTAYRSHVDLSTALSSYLVLVVAVAALGGVWPAALAAVVGFLLSNYYFAPPLHTFTIADARDILALVVFLVAAGVVSTLVDLSARRSAAAVRARADAHMLARMAGRLVSPQGNPLPELLDDLMVAFRLDATSVLRSDAESSPVIGTGVANPDRWSVVASAGPRPPRTPEEASLALPLTGHEVLALRGPGLSAEDRDIMAGFAAQLATALGSERLHVERSEADALKPTRSSGPTSSARRCWQPSVTTCAPRWPRSRPPPRACSPSSSPSARRRRRSSYGPSTKSRTG
jgi:two-component system sensor histidine kinase KdpD